ncbi:phosphatidate cytidylyltransferase [Risungbinella massiliensis]|uniref:phosphatidate cytidylyltransferase n=1 Tax=Risungbinella massiliensis TaxID=1329796 RepID=UPI0005CBF862|nr:phosphatidate cytidylyltransferase [Risungbinella massiliensis]
MKERVITGGLGAAGFLTLLYLGGWWYTTLIFIIALIAFWEYSRTLGYSQGWIPMGIGYLGVTLILLSNLPQLQGDSLFGVDLSKTYLLILLLYFIWMVLSRNHLDIYRLSFLFVGVMYIGFGFSLMMETVWRENGLGFALSLLVVLVTFANDSGAYFVGRKWGKRKLWPHISPKKTVEGSLAGIAFGVLFAIPIGLFFPILGSIPYVLFLGFLTAVVGQIGDLVESAIKRTTGVKDSGKILPGHGGMLDRFDSLLFTFLVLHIFDLL